MEGKSRKGRSGRPRIDVPSPVDVHVGSRVRLRRTLLGMSQGNLGQSIGLTFQQVQKYERGANRIGCSRLYDLSRVLDVPVSYFFEDMPSVSGHVRQTEATKAVGGAQEAERDPMTKRETLELVRAYYRIPDAQLRRRVFDLAKAMGAAADASK